MLCPNRYAYSRNLEKILILYARNSPLTITHHCLAYRYQKFVVNEWSGTRNFQRLGTVWAGDGGASGKVFRDCLLFLGYPGVRMVPRVTMGDRGYSGHQHIQAQLFARRASGAQLFNEELGYTSGYATGQADLTRRRRSPVSTR